MRNKQYHDFIFSLTSIFVNLFGDLWYGSLIHEKNINKSTFFLDYKNNKRRTYLFPVIKSFIQATKKYFSIVYLKVIFHKKQDISKSDVLIFKYNSNHLDFIDVGMKVFLPQKTDYNEIKYKQLLDKNSVCLFSFVRFVDLVIVLYKYILIFVKFQFKLSYLQWVLKEHSKRFLNCDANSFLSKDLHRSFAGDILIENLLYQRIFKNINYTAKSVRKIVYVYEGLAWEKFLCKEFTSCIGVETVGIVCSAVHDNVLNFFYSRSDYRLMPHPKRLGVLGSYQKGQFDDYFDNTFIYGAGRYHFLKDVTETCNTIMSKTKGILIVLSYDDKNNSALLNFVRSALGNNYTIRIKQHPKCPTKIKNTFYQFEKRNIKDIINDYNLVICSGDTSFAFEAFAYGKIIVCPKLLNQIVLNPLELFHTEGIVIVENQEKLKSFANKVYKYSYIKLCNWGYPSRNRSRREFINKFFNFVSEEEMNRRIFI